MSRRDWISRSILGFVDLLHRTVMDRPQGVNARLRQLPSVDQLIDSAGAGSSLPRWARRKAARDVLERVRDQLRAGSDGLALERIEEETRNTAVRLAASGPRDVLNATGVVLHTNLGRAPLASGAAEAVARAAVGYSDLELDLETGRRGSRMARLSEALIELSGAEDALVVNNNAAALFLAVDALAADREVVLSRGELVEIGGSFRVPEIMAASRASLREIGTTNRTHLRDYAAAIGPNTGLLLKVRRSNFEIRGFTNEVELGELSTLAAQHGIPLVEDRGSGTFLDMSDSGIPRTDVRSSLRDGADLVLFSGDKLLGGPQAGIALGKRELIERMRRSPLARALRVEKLVIAALDWTLRALLDDRPGEIPTVRMLCADPDLLRERAERLARRISEAGVSGVSVEAESSLVGGGAMPELELAGFVVRVDERTMGAKSAQLQADLLRGEPPVLTRVRDGALLLDPRTLEDSDLDAVANALEKLTV